MYCLTLELISGFLLLLALGSGGITWWLDQPENRRMVHQELMAQINMRLDSENDFAFTDMQIRFATKPLGAKIVLHNATLAQPEQHVHIRRIELDFPINNVLLGQVLPQQIILEHPVFTSNESTTPSAVSIDQLGAAILLWLAPERTPYTTWANLSQEIARIQVTDFRAELGTLSQTHSIVGNLLLHRNGSGEIEFDGKAIDTRRTKEPLAVQVALKRIGEKLRAKVTSEIPASLLPLDPALTAWKDWLTGLGTVGAARGEILFDLANINTSLRGIQRLEDIAKAAHPLQFQASVDWPRDNPVLSLQIDKAATELPLFRLSNTQPFTLPVMMEQTLPEIQQFHAEGQTDLLLQQFQGLKATLQFSEQASLAFAGDYDRIQGTGEFTFTLSGLDQILLPSNLRPKNISITAGQVVTAKGRVALKPDAIALTTLDAEAQGIILDLLGATARIPTLKVRWVAPNDLQVLAPDTIDYRDLVLHNTTLNGDPNTTLLGSTTLTLPPEVALEYIRTLPTLTDLNKFANVGLENDLRLTTKFIFDLKGNRVHLREVKSLAPIQGSVLNKPFEIEHLEFSDTDRAKLEVRGRFAGTVIIANSIDTNTGQILNLSVPQLPLTLIEQLLGEAEPASALTPVLQFTGSLNLKASARFKDGMQMLSFDADISDSGIEHPTFSNIKERGESGFLKLHVAPESDSSALWRLDFSGDTPNFGGKLTMLYDAKNHKITAIPQSPLRFRDQSLSITAQRHDDGLHISLNSTQWDEGRVLIEKIKRGTSAIPEAFAPISILSWQFSQGFNVDDLQFGAGQFSIAFNTQHPDGTEVLEPSFDTIKRLAFRFVESEPVQAFTAEQNQSSSSDLILKPATVEAHQLEFIPGMTLRINSPNTGKLLKIFDVTQVLSGGILSVNLNPINSRLQGSLSLNNFAVQNASGVVNFLQAISLTGLIPLLADQGLPFYVLNAEARGAGLQWKLNDLKAYGPGLSMTFSGMLNAEDETISGEGTASPTSALNAIIGSIPIVGTLLTGTDGGGLVAVNYTVSGDIRDPKVTAAPLSLLQPGILRNVFGSLGNALRGRKN